ncbi:MAG: helix-turn-helix transcriptional regulator [Clostridium sp.]|nr:helix-turn-helix transcriptional regulator [Clostridium sp.]
MINYEPLWKTMAEKKCSQYKLIRNGIDPTTISRIKANKSITLVTLEKLCKTLDCTPNDIVKFTD